MSNLKLWKSVEKTNPSDTKGAKIGQMKITAICPQSQRKRATEVFGPFGIGWGVKDEHTSFLDFDGGTKLCTYSATFWYKYEGEAGEFPITSNSKVAFITGGGNGYLKVDDEYSKKVSTDALTKGLSMLGFNADVFLGKFDDSKYVNQMKEEFAEPPAPQVDVVGELVKLGLDEAKVRQSIKTANFTDATLNKGWADNKDGLIKYFTEAK